MLLSTNYWAILPWTPCICYRSGCLHLNWWLCARRHYYSSILWMYMMLRWRQSAHVRITLTTVCACRHYLGDSLRMYSLPWRRFAHVCITLATVCIWMLFSLISWQNANSAFFSHTGLLRRMVARARSRLDVRLATSSCCRSGLNLPCIDGKCLHVLQVLSTYWDMNILFASPEFKVKHKVWER